VNVTSSTSLKTLLSFTVPSGYSRFGVRFSHGDAANTNTVTFQAISIQIILTNVQLNKAGLGVYKSPTSYVNVSKDGMRVEGQPLYFNGGYFYVVGDNLYWKKGAVDQQLN
jgi:hypothetical protein